jgi:hypothetical protein
MKYPGAGRDYAAPIYRSAKPENAGWLDGDRLDSANIRLDTPLTKPKKHQPRRNAI